MPIQPPRSEFLTLRDGRQMHCRVYGRGQRKIIFFHGYPGSSRQADLFAPYLESYDLTIISPDRPGYGQSHTQKELSFSEDLKDLHEIIQYFSINDVEFISVSGGTPFALNAAAAMGTQLHRLGVFCGLTPLGEQEFSNQLRKVSLLSLKAAPYLPGKLTSKLIHQISKTRSKKANAGKNLVLDFFMPKSESDWDVLKNSQVIQSLNTALTEAFASYGAGPKRDAQLYFHQAPLNYRNIKAEVHLYHGRQDQILPYTLAQSLQSRIPKATLTLTERDGHFSLPMNQLENYLQKST